jgi:hypothetical protein
MYVSPECAHLKHVVASHGHAVALTHLGAQNVQQLDNAGHWRTATADDHAVAGDLKARLNGS